MALTASTFVDAYPSFSTIDPATITAKLAIAYGRCAATLYGTRLDEAVGFLTAHLLWTDPAGDSLRLDGDQGSKVNQKSRYWREYCQVRRELGLNFLVVN
jgi:hypothetical protein